MRRSRVLGVVLGALVALLVFVLTRNPLTRAVVRFRRRRACRRGDHRDTVRRSRGMLVYACLDCESEHVIGPVFLHGSNRSRLGGAYNPMGYQPGDA